MIYLKCTAPGCAAVAHVTGINPSYCAKHTMAHYEVGGLDVSWWAEQTAQDRTVWRAAQHEIDVHIDLVMAKLREAIAARTSSGEPIDEPWFTDMTVAALRAIEIDPTRATVILSEALFETYFCDLAVLVPSRERHPGCEPWTLRPSGLRLAVDSAAMDSRLAYDDFPGERIVVVYPPINGLR